LRQFSLDNFSAAGADEVEAAFSYQPITCFIATYEKRIVGFAAYECTRRNYFGPTGVHPDFRGKGIGKALLLASLRAMLELGYAYAIIGGVGPTEFYSSCAGAILIPDSTPGVYTDMLARE
jgi:GNAT superfamily N-acetyltransferase